jgi:hypothetical protein
LRTGPNFRCGGQFGKTFGGEAGRERGGEIATGLISSLGDRLETTVHTVGNLGVTTMMEATRVLSATAVGNRQTLGSAISGNAPDFAEMERKEHELRESR